MYSMRLITPSSFTKPWKVGITGWKPETSFICGVRIDSLM